MKNRRLNSPKRHNKEERDRSKFHRKATNDYLKYSGMVFQMFFLLAIAFWAGKKLDQYFHFSKPILTIGLLLSALIGYFIKLYIDLSKDQK